MSIFIKKNGELDKVAGDASPTTFISDKYNPGKIYAPEEFCIWDNKLWKKIGTSESGITPTEGTSWTETKIDNELSQINGNLAQQTDYTTDEIIVGKWIDGSPIYRKIIQGTTSNDNATTIPINSTVSRVIKLDGFLYSSSGNELPIGWYQSSTDYFSAFVATATTVIGTKNSIQVRATNKNCVCKFILDFLK